jgi:hypothetical protein
MDTVPATGAVPDEAVLFPADTANPASTLAISDASQTGLDPTSAITIECWVYVLSWLGSTAYLIMKDGLPGASYSNYEVNFDESGNRIYFSWQTGSGATRIASAPTGLGNPWTGAWAHIAVTRDTTSGVNKIYVNGLPATLDLGATVDAGVPLQNNIYPVEIGGRTIGNFTQSLHGYMAELRLWSVVRTPAEILASYNTDLVGNEAGLEGYWPLHTDLNDLTANANNLSAIGGANPTPALSAITRPFASGIVAPRTFVCVGDPVIGWLDDAATDLQYKHIPLKVMPPDTPTLQTWLGVDGTVTTDIAEDSSHFWKFEALPSVDVGTLATASFNLGGIGTPVLTTDPDYWEGLENVIVLDALTDSLATGNSTKIPSVQDGTKSLILGGVMQVDDQELVDVNSWLISQHNTSGVDGWNVAMWNAIGGGGDALKLRWVLYQGGVATQCVALIPIVYGVPFAWIANLDWAAGKMKVMTSTPGSYNEVAVADTGDFDVGIDPVRVSGSVVTNIASYLGTQGHLFSYQYSSAIDAGINEATMTRYKKFLSGNKGP